MCLGKTALGLLGVLLVVLLFGTQMPGAWPACRRCADQHTIGHLLAGQAVQPFGAQQVDEVVVRKQLLQTLHDQGRDVHLAQNTKGVQATLAAHQHVGGFAP
jgi:hypothetical protein